MNVIIPYNTTNRNKATKNYTTKVNSQTKLDFQIYKGEFLYIEKNNYLRNILLTDILQAEAYLLQIKVIFEINTNSILNVSALDTSIGKLRNITIKNNKGRLSYKEIERIIVDAAKYRAEDKALVISNLARNLLEKLLILVAQEVKDNPNLTKGASIKEIEAVYTQLGLNKYTTKAKYKTQSEKLKNIRQSAKRRKFA